MRAKSSPPERSESGQTAGVRRTQSLLALGLFCLVTWVCIAPLLANLVGVTYPLNDSSIVNLFSVVLGYYFGAQGKGSPSVAEIGPRRPRRSRGAEGVGR